MSNQDREVTKAYRVKRGAENALLAHAVLNVIEAFPGEIHRAELYNTLTDDGHVCPITIFTDALHYLEMEERISIDERGYIALLDDWSETTQVNPAPKREIETWVKIDMPLEEAKILAAALNDHSHEGLRMFAIRLAEEIRRGA